jgi:hypothetical protein
MLTNTPPVCSPTGTPPPLSLPLSPTPVPAATTPSAAASVTAALTSSLKVSVLLPSLSPLAPLLASRGRPKQERWKDDSPSPSSDGSPPVKSLVISFRDALLNPSMSTPVAPSVVVGTVVPASAGLPAPHAQTADLVLAGAEGWQKVESKRSRRSRLKSARPRRPVPADLTGKCFNCFSTSHFALQCRHNTGCFRCNGLGHRSAWCPGVPSEGDIVRPRRRMVLAKVWRPKLQATMEMKSVLATGTSSTLLSGSGAVAAGEIVPSIGVNFERDSTHSRRQRRPRKRQGSARGHQNGSMDPVPVDSSELGSPLPRSGQLDLPVILDWSDQMSQAKDDLLNAVVDTVISDRHTVAEGEDADLIAPRLEVEAATLVLRRLSSSSFLLVLPRMEMVVILTEGRSVLLAASFFVTCKQWTRLLGSLGGILPALVDFELRGIPVHAWRPRQRPEFLAHLLGFGTFIRTLKG